MSRKSLLLFALLVLSPSGFASHSAFGATANNLICKGCVGSTDVAKQAVRSRHIKDGQVKPQDLAKSAKPSGIASAAIRSDLIENLPVNVNKIVRVVTIEAPGPGAVLASYSMSARSVATGGVVTCAATTGTTVDNTLFNIRLSVDANVIEPFSGMDVIPVSSDGSVTVNLVCRAGNQAGEYIHPVLVLQYMPLAGQIIGAAEPVAGKSSDRARR